MKNILLGAGLILCGFVVRAAGGGLVPRDLSAREESLRARSRERRASISALSAAQAAAAALLHKEVLPESSSSAAAPTIGLAGRATGKRPRLNNCDEEELAQLEKQQVQVERNPKAPRLDGQSGMRQRLSDLDLASRGAVPVDPTRPLIVTLNRLMPGKK
ncbi:hypothetical protein EBQ93_03640 [bacterium]|nr:hypothetical protein [bacterium]